jgi:hypothetical protein
VLERNLHGLKSGLQLLIKEQKYSYLTARVAIYKFEDRRELIFGRIDFFKEPDLPVTEVLYYDTFELWNIVYEISEVDQVLSELDSNIVAVEKEKLTLSASNTNRRIVKVPSGHPYWMLDSEVPYFLVKLRIDGQVMNEEIEARPGLPYYPDIAEALRQYMNLAELPFNKEFAIILPETRSYITQLRIVGKEIIMTREHSGQDEQFVAKFTCSRGKTIHDSSEDVTFKDNQAKFQCKFEPDTVRAALVHRRTMEMIDRKEFRGLYTTQRGVVVQTPESLISEMIANGESKHVEFKTGIQDDDELMETIVSFANSEGGTILVGVTDNKAIRGFFDNPERAETSIAGQVRGQCEPTIEPMMQWAKIDGKPILVIRVQEGKDKPYNVKDRGIYVRELKDDYRISRARLDSIYDSKRQPAQYTS